MEYHRERDKDSRHIQIEVNSVDPFFNAKVSLEFPSPAYKYELSNDEIRKFSVRLLREWGQIYSDMVKELLKR